MTHLRQIFDNLPKLSDKWLPYFDVYERHLSRFINTSPSVLEIGIQKGGSIHMWLDWFGAGTTIVGVDIDPACASLDYPSSVQIAIGDQADKQFWQTLLSTGIKFDVIVDDGGHTMNQQRVSLECLWNSLNEGGVYICEDTHTSYWADWGGGFDHPQSFQTYSKRLTDVLNKEHISQGMINRNLANLFGNTLNSVTFYNSQIVFEKRTAIPFERVFSHES